MTGPTYLRDLLRDMATSDLAWMDFRACAEIDPELWFPHKGGNPEPAKAVCFNVCTVRQECLAFGLNDEFGVWGGLTESERRQLRRRNDAPGVAWRRVEASAAMRAEARRLAELGWDVDTLAAHFDRHRDTVLRWLRGDAEVAA